MKLSISNLAWENEKLDEMILKFISLEFDGIEIAPTALWPDFDNLSLSTVEKLKKKFDDSGLLVSGIQSLLFGNPKFQLLDRTTWPMMSKHLKKMCTIAGTLEASVAVFGSPKNRIKGSLSSHQANVMAGEFFSNMIPLLEENNLVLTLEPNAIEYGGDFLTNYKEVIALTNIIGSKWIRPQLDTGCAQLSGDNLIQSYNEFIPHHIHLSAPGLGSLPGEMELTPFLEQLLKKKYDGWLVIEILATKVQSSLSAFESAVWLKNQIASISNE